MFGYIKKSKVLKIINDGYEQLNDAEYEITFMSKSDIEKDIDDYKRSVNEIKGAKRALQGLIKHFI